jgi:hypothetical protein
VSVCFSAAKPEGAGEGCMLALARGPLIANLAVAQVGSALEVRCRTSTTDASGAGPHVISPAGLISGARQRLVFVRAMGRHVIYLDGVAVASAEVKGDLSCWEDNCTLALGRDPQGGSPWSGTIHEVRFWPRALAQADVEQLDHVEVRPEGVRTTTSDRGAHVDPATAMEDGNNSQALDGPAETRKEERPSAPDQDQAVTDSKAGDGGEVQDALPVDGVVKPGQDQKSPGNTQPEQLAPAPSLDVKPVPVKPETIPGQADTAPAGN